jgi:hypothetical protein
MTQITMLDEIEPSPPAHGRNGKLEGPSTIESCSIKRCWLEMYAVSIKYSGTMFRWRVIENCY